MGPGPRRDAKPRTVVERPLRVLYVVPTGPGAHAMIFAHNEIARMSAAGLETATFRLEAGTTDPRKALRAGRALRRLERVYRPHLVHAHFGALTAFTCAVACRAPLVVTYRGSDLNPSPTDGRVRNAAQKLLSQLAALRARAIICVSRQLRDRLWWGQAKATVVPTGIDLDLFRPVPLAEARLRLAWPCDEPVVLFNAGGRPAGKRLDLAVAAVDQMRELLGPVRLEVLDGATPHHEMPVYLSAADCLLVTSDFEGSPDIVKEALAVGLPVVSVDVGDVAERLRGVVPCRIVAREPRALAVAAAEIVRSRARSNGRAHIAELAADTVRDQVIAVYHRVLA